MSEVYLALEIKVEKEAVSSLKKAIEALSASAVLFRESVKIVADISALIDAHEERLATLELRDKKYRQKYRLSAYGRSDREISDCGRDLFWLFPGDVSEKEIERFIREERICKEYNGPGQIFTDEPRISRTNTRVLVTQYIGMDV